jgi:D-amino peptidase
MAAEACPRDHISPPESSFPMTRIVLPLLMIMLTISSPVEAQTPLNVFISADLEGVAGAVTPEQLGPSGFEYARFREFMTDEVLAAIDGARAAGATRIVVADSHGNAQNLLIERFPEDVEIVRGWPRPLHMMQGIDDSFHAAIFIGYHSAATNMEGVRAHTFSSANLAAVRLNGVDASEGLVNAAIAGHFGVPVVFVSGDDVVVEETRALLGDVEGVAVKQAIGLHSAQTLTPAAAQLQIRQGVERALARRDDFRPYRLPTPITLEVTFKNYRPVELLAFLPIVERSGARTIRFQADTMPEIARFTQFILNYQSDLSP